MPEPRRGRYTVFEGLDGIGKGAVIGAVSESLEGNGKQLVGFDNWCDFPEEPGSDIHDHPHLAYLVAEPSYFGVGAAIRRELIAKHNRKYSVEAQRQAYALDRWIQLQRVILPALKNGSIVLSSRNVASSLCYQALGAIKEGRGEEYIGKIREEILSIEGNKFAMQNAPDLLVISTIKDVDDLIARLSARTKQDNCIFENVEFQRALKPFYEDPWLRELFEKAGSKVAYLDAGISLESTREQAVEIYTDFHERGIIKPRYQNP
ncbi:MAG TPA: hypothetical protein VHA12_01910 [Candidatus Nanoarchaeia archaeon]|nr:hypothetical protein [Candidatus Nanoarchaeia archaeon]